MIRRFGIAVTFALLGLFGLTEVADAARGPDATEVMVGTFVVALAMMGLLLAIYWLKVATGIEKPLPPEEPGASAGHH